jgi:Lrp/AsnC family transcriptional regulator, regulator for asnA, asnC and gidA
MPLMSQKLRIRASSRPANQPYDELDRQIIALLQQDGRRPNTEIGQLLGVTETTVRKRIGRLVSDRLIKIVAVPSPEVVGMTMSAIIGITTEMNALHDVAAALEELPQTRYVGYSTGPYDVIIEVFFRSHEELLELLSKKLSRIPGIAKTDTSVILKVTKFAYEWEVPDYTVQLPGGETAPRPGA